MTALVWPQALLLFPTSVLLVYGTRHFDSVDEDYALEAAAEELRRREGAAEHSGALLGLSSGVKVGASELITSKTGAAASSDRRAVVGTDADHRRADAKSGGADNGSRADPLGAGSVQSHTGHASAGFGTAMIEADAHGLHEGETRDDRSAGRSDTFCEEALDISLRIGCRQSCACGWAEVCYPFFYTDKPGEDIGMCGWSVITLVVISITILAGMMLVLLLLRFELVRRAERDSAVEAALEHQQRIEERMKERAKPEWANTPPLKLEGASGPGS